MKPKDVLAFAKENGAKMLDLRFMDFPGLWQHFSVPIGQLDEGNFEDGFGFDGSSIRGWQPLNARDMLVIPDPTTAKMDLFTQAPTMGACRCEAWVKSPGRGASKSSSVDMTSVDVAARYACAAATRRVADGWPVA